MALTNSIAATLCAMTWSKQQRLSNARIYQLLQQSVARSMVVALMRLTCKLRDLTRSGGPDLSSDVT